MKSEADLLRDAGVDLVAQHNEQFMDAAFALLPLMRSRHPGEVTGEEIHLWLDQQGVRAANPNCYGALLLKARRAGLLVRTGRTVKMRRPSSHGRENPVYRWVDAGNQTTLPL
jgi:hypothetical protein